MHPRHAVLQHLGPAAPVLDDRLGLTGQHRRHERVGQHTGHSVTGVQGGLGDAQAQIPRADEQRLTRLQHVRLVGQVGQPGPAGAEGLEHGGALPDRPIDRAQRAALLRVPPPEKLAVAVEGGQRFVNP